MSSSVFIQKHITANDSTSLAYRVYPGKRGFPMVIFVHGLFGSAKLFNPIASILSKRGIPSIAIDLRGFGESGRGKITIEAFSDDLLTILETEKLVSEREGEYRYARPMVLVGYSLGTLVTSLTKKRVIESDGGTRAMIGGLPIDGECRERNEVTLCHISPIMAIKKRRLLRHFLLPEIQEVDFGILSHPWSFIHLIWEILSARRYIDLAGYIFTGRWDFCFYRESSQVDDTPYTVQVFEEENHYLLYRVPQALASYLLQIILGKTSNRTFSDKKSPVRASSVEAFSI